MSWLGVFVFDMQDTHHKSQMSLCTNVWTEATLPLKNQREPVGATGSVRSSGEGRAGMAQTPL